MYKNKSQRPGDTANAAWCDRLKGEWVYEGASKTSAPRSSRRSVRELSEMKDGQTK